MKILLQNLCFIFYKISATQSIYYCVSYNSNDSIIGIFEEGQRGALPPKSFLAPFLMIQSQENRYIASRSRDSPHCPLGLRLICRHNLKNNRYHFIRELFWNNRSLVSIKFIKRSSAHTINYSAY